MSKINDAITVIKEYLSGNDHSDSPVIRQAATVYSQACQEINDKLAECRQLIQRGLLLDARKLDIEMQPSLCERAEKLILPPEKFSRFQELCRLYNYPVAPAIDQTVIEQLTQNSGSKEELLKELILRWRKIARTGTNPEKIKLLRQIISNVPSDDQIWRSNLSGVERQWVNDLQKEAQIAIQDGDGEKITRIYMHLTDPKLQKPVSESLLGKLRPHVNKYQKMILEQELKRKRSEIFSAYSSQNLDYIAGLLREYDILITHPLYTPDKKDEAAINEVRKYLQQELNKQEIERIHAQKLAELTRLLDNNGDYTLIENLYESLQKNDIPLDILISRRVMNRRDEYLSELNRKHIRKCIYSILGGVLILIVAGIVFHIIQTTRTYLSTQKSMEQLLATGNNHGVLKLHDSIKQKNPVLLRFGNLNALRLQAEKAIAEQTVQEKKLTDYLNKAGEILQTGVPNLQELKLIQKSIEDLQIKQIPPELDSRLQKINFAIIRLDFNTKQQQEQFFTNQHRKLQKMLADCQREMDKKSSDLPLIKKSVLKIMKDMQDLTDNSPGVSDKLRKGHNALLQEQGKTLLISLENIGARRRLLITLSAPENYEQYCEALKKLPATAPDLASGSWRDILSAIHFMRTLASGATLAVYENHADLEKALSEQQINLSDSCFVRDLTRILPDKYFKEKYKNAVSSLQNDLSDLYDCYELTFVDKENNYWHFYSADPPQIDKRRSSRIPKALGISVMISPGSPGKALPLRLERNKAGKIVYVPKKFDEMALPDVFVELKNMPITSTVFPKSQQSQILHETISILNRCQTPEQMTTQIVKPINKLLNAASMNIFARAYLLRRLLDIYGLASEFHLMAVNSPNLFLDHTAQKLYGQWYTPTVSAENPSTVKKLNGFFKEFSPNKLKSSVDHAVMLHKLALSRGLTPGGIVLASNNNQYKLHWFKGQQNISELWFYQTGAPVGWVALNKKEHVDKKSGLLINHQLKLIHGAVFFVPFDGRNTAALAREIKQQAAEKNITDISWPETWPVNQR